MTEKKKDERETIEFWKKPPHNCTEKEAIAQVDKFKQDHEAQNA